MAIRVREEDHFSVELTPLIDVVFLLLVFFLVATTFQQLERELGISVPESETGESTKEGPQLVVVNLIEEGRIVVEGNSVTLEQLEALLARRAEDCDELKALIRADRTVTLDLLVPVADACRKAHASIALATLEDKQ